MKITTIGPGLVSLFYLLIVLAVTGDTGCRPKQAMDATAAAIYAAELQECVAKSHTLQESKDCREGVDKKWGVK